MKFVTILLPIYKKPTAIRNNNSGVMRSEPRTLRYAHSTGQARLPAGWRDNFLRDYFLIRLSIYFLLFLFHL